MLRTLVETRNYPAGSYYASLHNFSPDVYYAIAQALSPDDTYLMQIM
ncbi:MAG: hypothetical protein ACR9NN_08655 [Nostochopsis sp.]